MKTRYKIIFSLVLLMVLSPLVTGCIKKEPLPRISLKDFEVETQEQQRDVQEETLRIAISPIISPKQNIVDYGELLKFLEKNLNVKVKLIQRKTYAEVNELIKTGQVDLAFVCTAAYVKGKSDFGMELLVVPQVRGQKTYQSYIIAANDSGINSFADLKGKKFAFTDPLSTTGGIYPLKVLKILSQSPENYFKEYIYTYSHDNSIKAVYEGLVDGAAVDSLVFQFVIERNAKYASRLKVVGKSAEYSIPPVVVRPGLDSKLKEQLQNLFLDMHKLEKGKRILNSLYIDQFVLQDDADYDSVRELMDVVRN